MPDVEGEEAAPIVWDVRRDARTWSATEAHARLRLAHGLDLEIDIVRGKLYWSEEARVAILAMVLESLGLDAAVRLAPLERWTEALAEATARAAREATT
jgi:hypothetical protein